MARPKKQPYAPIRRFIADPDSWFCAYGMHKFEWTKDTIPVDCPDNHALRTMLLDEINSDAELRKYYKENYNSPFEELTKQQVAELVNRIKIEDDSQNR